VNQGEAEWTLFCLEFDFVPAVGRAVCLWEPFLFAMTPWAAYPKLGQEGRPRKPTGTQRMCLCLCDGPLDLPRPTLTPAFRAELIETALQSASGSNMRCALPMMEVDQWACLPIEVTVQQVGSARQSVPLGARGSPALRSQTRRLGCCAGVVGRRTTRARGTS
jgi:hypothetical protein